MRASLTLDKSGLDNIIKKFKDPIIKEELNRLPQNKGIIALVSQAIADNFDKEGPGWPPLKQSTIERSLKKHSRKRKATREEPSRRILRDTNLLMKTVTTAMPNASFSNKKGLSGRNIFKTEGSHLIWGTDLGYAGVHQNGYPARNIPQRKFLTIRPEWLKQIEDFVINKAFKVVVERITKGGS